MMWAVLVAAIVVSGTTGAVGAEVVCDPTLEFCDDAFTSGAPEAPVCDAAVDPTCDPFFSEPYPADTVPFDGSTCDPLVDPTCDPYTSMPYPYDGPVCDLAFDPTCDPAALGALGPNETLVPSPTTAPPAIAFEQPAFAAPAEIVTRADVSDDVDAADVPVGDIPSVAASRLVLAMDALAELSAFRRSPSPDVGSAIRDLSTNVPEDGLDADGYVDELRRLVDDMTIYLEQLEASGVEPSDELFAVESALAEAIDEIGDGETNLLDAEPFFPAIADLVVRDGAAPEGERDPASDLVEVLSLSEQFVRPAAAPEAVTSTTSTAPTTSTVEPVELPETSADDQVIADDVDALAEPEGDNRTVAIAVAGVILLTIVVAIAARRRKRPDDVITAPTSAATELLTDTTSNSISVGDLLDASRRMTASLDTTTIVGIALSEARRLVGAEGGLVVLRDGDDLQSVGAEPVHFFQPESADDSIIRRVVETGRSVANIANDDPILVEVPVAMAAVAIVVDGTVAGSLMVVRIPSDPFGRDEIEALEMLAPLVGSALHAAAEHGTATALVDVEPMTGLKNRRRLDRDMAAYSDGQQVAYVMVDVDHFKNFNDVNGHAAGDEALRQVAKALSVSVRPVDVVYRYGGEEFCVLLPGATTAEAMTVAERARAAVEALDVPGGENQPAGRVTISVGVADTTAASIDDLIERADGALYDAKQNGRNQVRAAI